VVVVQGWDDGALRRAPGHLPKSAMPGEGNCVIAGHRNIYGSWFYRLDELWPDAVIRVETPRASFTYRVVETATVSDMDTTILQPPAAGAAPRLTLITCTVPHSSERLVVTAELST
jgi:sortase A